MVENKTNSPQEIFLKDGLYSQWQNLCDHLQVSPQKDIFDQITNHYSEPQRHYHTLNHINSCLQELEPIRASLNDPEAVETAIWFHDFVYDPGPNQNEEKSAQFAKDILQATGLSSEFTAKVSDLILSTKHISPSEESDTQYLNDIDMAILGQSSDIFDKFDQDIEKEFIIFYSPEIYLNGRIKFFDTMLNRENIFLTDHFKNKCQKQAQENIERKKTELLKRLNP